MQKMKILIARINNVVKRVIKEQRAEPEKSIFCDGCYNSYSRKEKPPEYDPNGITTWYEAKNQQETEKAQRDLQNLLIRYR